MRHSFLAAPTCLVLLLGIGASGAAADETPQKEDGAPPAASTSPTPRVEPDPNHPTRRTAVVGVAERLGPAVVNVHADQVVQTRVRTGEGIDGFFKDFMQPRYQEEYATTSLGSGVLIDPHHVVTNQHVIASAERVRIRMSDRREFACTVVGVDPDLDLAVLRVQTEEDLPHVMLGESRDVMVGETVIAIGNPFGLQHTVTSGVVSALHRSILAPERTYHDFLQTDASINPGNSGGPLLDIEGRLVGINTAMYGGSQGIGFAIPVNRVRRIAGELIRAGKIRPLYLGLSVRYVDRKLKDAKKLPRLEGVHITEVAAGSPAEKAGVRMGDVVLAIEDFPVLGEEDFTAKMRDYAPGTDVALTLWSEGAEKELVVPADEAPEGFALKVLEQQLGLKLVALDADSRTDLGIPPDAGNVEKLGYAVEAVRDGSYGEKADIQRGDLLYSVNAVDSKDAKAVDEGLFKARRGGRLDLALKRGAKAFTASFGI